MKICISSSGSSKDSPVDPRFGRCQYFAVYDGEKFDFVKNEAWRAPRGAGIAATQKVADLSCQVVITGNVGPNAFYALQSAGIKVCTGVFGKTVKEALKEFREGKLSEVQMPTRRFGFGMGRGRRGRR